MTERSRERAVCCAGATGAVQHQGGKSWLSHWSWFAETTVNSVFWFGLLVLADLAGEVETDGTAEFARQMRICTVCCSTGANSLVFCHKHEQ